MIHHIPFLNESILLCALLFPGGLSSIIPRPRKNIFLSTMICNISVYVVLLLFMIIVGGNRYLYFNNAPVYFYLLAPIAGLLCIAAEYAIGAIQLFIRFKKLPESYRVHSFYDMEKGLAIFMLIAALVLCEELVLRQFFFTVFYDTFNLNVVVAIVLCALVYSLNHLYFGVNTLVQKFISGVIYTVLFYLSGFSIIIPFIAHTVQNITLVFMSKAGGK